MPLYLTNPPEKTTRSDYAENTTKSVTNVSSVLLTAKSWRKGFILSNKSEYRIFVAFDEIASPSNSSIILQPNAVYESGFLYCGSVSAIVETNDATVICSVSISDFT